MEIWHNPRCTKSRTARDALAGAGFTVQERRYLDQPPTVAELEDVLARLGLEPWDITRMAEPAAKELDLRNLVRDRTKWIEVLAANPALIQRPIVVTDGGRAFVVRDEESLETVLQRP
ncbi:MAG: ArsC/Spx/MgsR family protein [Streptosporangiaceae bacterium]